MSLLSRFTKLMKSEPTKTRKRMNNSVWIIDERKCLSMSEIKKLRITGKEEKSQGLKNNRFSLIRNWFMVELGLNAGLRVGEMASLLHENLILDGDRSSIIVFGKGNKKRAVWINSGFKQTCQRYLAYKNNFGYETNTQSPLLNNLAGSTISKRALQKFFKAILAKAGLPSYYYIHCLRHTFTTFLLKASNHNYRFAQQQLGHSSIRTTQVYASVLESEGKKALERLYR